MPQSTETEIKLVASPSMLCRLREHSALAAAERTQTLRTTYFDTAGRRLGKNGASLRIRETEAAPPVQTLKLVTAAGAVRRREWTTEIADDVPEVAAFARTPKILLRRLTGGVPMHPFAVIETTGPSAPSDAGEARSKWRSMLGSCGRAIAALKSASWNWNWCGAGLPT